MDMPQPWHRLRQEHPDNKTIQDACDQIKRMAEGLWSAKDMMMYRCGQVGRKDAELIIDPILRRFWDWKG